jgi:hypothetical protein
VQLVRLGDDGLAEFFQRYVSWALEIYLSARRAPSAFDAVTGVATTFSRPFAQANPLLRPFRKQIVALMQDLRPGPAARD